MQKNNIGEVVSNAIENYRKFRDLKRAHQMILDAARSGILEIGYLDNANQDFETALRSLAEEEDGEVPDQWEVIKENSLTSLAGIMSEHTETDIDVDFTAAKGGAEEHIAPPTAD